MIARQLALFSPSLELVVMPSDVAYLTRQIARLRLGDRFDCTPYSVQFVESDVDALGNGGGRYYLLTRAGHIVGKRIVRSLDDAEAQRTMATALARRGLLDGWVVVGGASCDGISRERMARVKGMG